VRQVTGIQHGVTYRRLPGIAAVHIGVLPTRRPEAQGALDVQAQEVLEDVSLVAAVGVLVSSLAVVGGTLGRAGDD